MAYDPPLEVLNAGWQGAEEYRPCIERQDFVWLPQHESTSWCAPVWDESLRVGAPVLHWTLFSDPQSIAPREGYGGAFVTLDYEYIPLWEVLNLTWQGAPSYGAPLEIVPSSWQTRGIASIYPRGVSTWRDGATVLHWELFAAPPGIAPRDGYGGGFVTLNYEYIPRWEVLNLSWQWSDYYVPNVEQQDFVWLIHREGTRYIAPIGESGLSFGGATAWLSQQGVHPAGMRAFASGHAFIWNTAQVVRAGGVYRGAFGTQEARNRNTYVFPKGGEHSVISTPEVSSFLRYLDARAIWQFETGTAWISFGSRRLAADGIKPPALPARHHVGAPPEIRPQGFDASAFGGRIIPETQTLHPLGEAHSLFPRHVLGLRRRRITPEGFTTCKEEPQRFGWGELWNLRQWIIVPPLTAPYDIGNGKAEDSLTLFGHRATVLNRNRVLGTYGALFSRYGYTSLRLNARLLAPPGVASLSLPTPLIAARVREYGLTGFDASQVSRAGVIYNAAFLLVPHGEEASAFGLPGLEKNQQTIRYAGTRGQTGYGVALVAYRIRYLGFTKWQTLDSLRVTRPDIRLHTRYVTPAGLEAGGLGGHWLRHYRGLVGPFWIKKFDDIGAARIHNVTPELHPYGLGFQVFGTQSIRTQWRRMDAVGFDALRMGTQRIADRRLWIRPRGEQTLRVSHLAKVERDELSYPYTRSVAPAAILPPEHQVSKADLRQRWVNAFGIDAFRSGKAWVSANTIRVNPGVWLRNFLPEQKHLVGNRVNRIGPLVGIKAPESPQSPPKPRVSPHTVYACIEAPAQAMQNHPVNDLHVVDGKMRPYKGVGAPTVTNQHRGVRVGGMSFMHLTSGHEVALRRHYIRPDGLHRKRFGYHRLYGGLNGLTVLYPVSGMALGRHVVGFVPVPVAIAPRGWTGEFGKTLIEHFNRTYAPKGYAGLMLGYSRPGTRYMPQSLNVGPPDWPPIEGFDSNLYGAAWISNRVRDVAARGEDSFVCDYELEKFKERLQVTRGEGGGNPEPPEPPVKPPERRIKVLGVDSMTIYVPNVQHAQYYVLPDGNAEQFRKAGADAGNPPAQGVGVAGIDSFAPMGQPPTPKPQTQHLGGIGTDSFTSGQH